MFRKLVCALFVMGVGVGLVAAEEFTASISKVDGKNVTFFKTQKGKKDDKETTLPVADDLKVNKGKFSFKDKKFAIEVGDPIEKGLQNELFTKIDEKKGVTARITTDADNKKITQITVVQFGGIKGKDKKKTDK